MARHARLPLFTFVPAIGLSLIVGGCAGRGAGSEQLAPLPAAPGPALAELAPQAPDSVLAGLSKHLTIGSAVDPKNGAQNPYGLAVAPATAGKLVKGDLVLCNFNAKSNVQGTGESIVALHAVPGSKPVHISEDESLRGCDALALGAGNEIWAAAMTANDNPVLAPTGALQSNIKGKPFNQPWGQAYGAPKGGAPAFYATNARTGTIVRINLGAKFTYDVIGKGFPVNRGVPGTALAPSGLAYDAKIDTLYFADGKNDTIVAFRNVSRIPNGGIASDATGMKFSGPAAADARVVFAGKPLNGPISTALLYNGNLVVGNTLDPTGKNLLIEISPTGKVLTVINVDKGPAGALFGIVATGTSALDEKVYFNDDNRNDVEVLER